MKVYRLYPDTFASSIQPVDRTIQQYENIREVCRSIFLKKSQDYGTSWRILRPSSLTDQLLIKASRIRSIEERHSQKVDEMPDVEYAGLINYSIMALIQLELGSHEEELDWNTLVKQYDHHFDAAFELMKRKNHDYGEIWRQMRITSFTDLILSKILRIRKIEQNGGITTVSEGIASNYYDIINYGVFALIVWSETKPWSFKY